MNEQIKPSELPNATGVVVMAEVKGYDDKAIKIANNCVSFSEDENKNVAIKLNLTEEGDLIGILNDKEIRFKNEDIIHISAGVTAKGHTPSVVKFDKK